MSFADQLLQALSRTFLHSLWQGLVLAIVAGLIILFTAKTSSSLRYRLLTTFFFAFLVCMIVTFYQQWNAVAAGDGLLRSNADQTSLSTLLQHVWLKQLSESIPVLLHNYSSWIVLTWSLIVLFKAGKMILDLLYISRLRSHRLYSPAGEWTARLETLADDMGIKRLVCMMESGMIKVPMVLGHLKPMILMPVGILNNMSAAEVEAVLLHELAHIRRNDYLINFLQRIAECILFFNPGMLWVSALIRIERENCCDDLAIARTDNRLQFAEALISFKKYSMNPHQYTLGFAGRKNVLLQRMTRIVYRKNSTLTPGETVFFIASIALISFLVFSKTDPADRVLAETAMTVEIQSMPTSDKRVSPNVDLPVKKSSKRVTKNRSAEPDLHNTSREAATPVTAHLHDLTSEVIVSEDDESHHSGLTEQQHSAAEQRHTAALMREEAEKQREKAEANRLIAEKQRAEAEVMRKRAEEAREIAAFHRREADARRAEADQQRKLAEEDRKRLEYNRRQLYQQRPVYPNTY